MTAEDFPRPLRVYAVGLALATVMLGAFLISRAELPQDNQLGLALVLTALVTITANWRVRIVSSNYDMTLDFGPAIAALILFDPGVAMVIAFVGTLASEVLRRRHPVGVLINSIDLTFATGCGGLVLAAGGGVDPARLLGKPGYLALALVAVVTLI